MYLSITVAQSSKNLQMEYLEHYNKSPLQRTLQRVITLGRQKRIEREEGQKLGRQTTSGLRWSLNDKELIIHLAFIFTTISWG